MYARVSLKISANCYDLYSSYTRSRPIIHVNSPLFGIVHAAHISLKVTPQLRLFIFLSEKIRRSTRWCRVVIGGRGRNNGIYGAGSRGNLSTQLEKRGRKMSR